MPTTEAFEDCIRNTQYGAEWPPMLSQNLNPARLKANPCCRGTQTQFVSTEAASSFLLRPNKYKTVLTIIRLKDATKATVPQVLN